MEAPSEYSKIYQLSEKAYKINEAQFEIDIVDNYF